MMIWTMRVRGDRGDEFFFFVTFGGHTGGEASKGSVFSFWKTLTGVTLLSA